RPRVEDLLSTGAQLGGKSVLQLHPAMIRTDHDHNPMGARPVLGASRLRASDAPKPPRPNAALSRLASSVGERRARTRDRMMLLMALDVVHDVLDGPDLLRFLVRDLHVVLFLERHHQLDDV